MFFNPSQLKKDAELVFIYLEKHHNILPSLPVQPDVKPGFLRHDLQTHCPMIGRDITQILDEIDKKLVPGMTKWHHPHFYAYYPSETTHATVLGEIMSTAFNNPNFSWHVSPTATELENIICDWIVQMLGLPATMMFKSKGGGAIINSVTEGVFCSVNAAKYKKCKELDIKFGDLRVFNFVAYFPESSQFWARKALFIKEIQHQRMLPMKYSAVLENYEIDTQALEELIQEDISKGLIPFWFGASLGATALGTSDDIAAIGKICQKYKIFLNCDAAYKGTQWVCHELREQNEALQYVDTILINFAKNMMMGMHGCTIFVKDRENLMESNGKLLEKNEIYQNAFNGEYDIVDYKDWTVGFGKKFNSMKFYIVFNYFGTEGMQRFVRQKIDLAIHFKEQIIAYGYFDFPIKREIGLICFNLKQLNNKTSEQMIELNRRLLQQVNQMNPEEGFISGTFFAGQYSLRFLANNSTCTQDSVNVFINKLIKCTQELLRVNNDLQQ